MSLNRLSIMDNVKILIRADKRPAREHAGRYKQHFKDGAAIIILDEKNSKRDIALHKHSRGLQRASETHRSYVALQYPLMFWNGRDGYNFQVKQIDCRTRHPTQKSVSSKNFFSFLLMVRKIDFNHLLPLQFSYLTSQFLVDTYAKIESERLLHIRLNQTKLRSDS